MFPSAQGSVLCQDLAKIQEFLARDGSTQLGVGREQGRDHGFLPMAHRSKASACMRRSCPRSCQGIPAPKNASSKPTLDQCCSYSFAANRTSHEPALGFKQFEKLSMHRQPLHLHQRREGNICCRSLATTPLTVVYLHPPASRMHCRW